MQVRIHLRIRSSHGANRLTFDHLRVEPYQRLLQRTVHGIVSATVVKDDREAKRSVLRGEHDCPGRHCFDRSTD